jgi:hypothetical protein
LAVGGEALGFEAVNIDGERFAQRFGNLAGFGATVEEAQRGD